VADSLGRAWVTARSVYAIFDGMGVRSYGELIKLNLAFDAAVYTSASPQVSALGMQFFANPKAAWEDFHKIADEGEVLTACQNAVLSSTWVSDGGIDIETEQTFNVRGYSSDDLGGAALYGTGAGIVIANGHVFTRDSEGIKAYKAAP
jgi:hypothetical protein